MKLEVRHLKKSFGEKKAVNDISFTVESGRTMGFLGRNGAGKTTTMRCIMEVFHQDEGEILLDGEPFRRSEVKVGYLPEERGMYSEVSLVDQLCYFAELKGMNRIAALKAANKWIDALELGDYAKKKLKTLSKGNKQKIQISQALIDDPDILILDEPFSGLDPVNAMMIKDLIAEYMQSKDVLLIFSSHQMTLVEQFCVDVVMIQQGQLIVTGSLEELKNAMNIGDYEISVYNRTPEALYQILQEQAPDLGARVEENPVKKEQILRLQLPTEEKKQAFYQFALGHQLDLKSFEPVDNDLETIFINLAKNDELASEVQAKLLAKE